MTQLRSTRLPWAAYISLTLLFSNVGTGPLRVRGSGLNEGADEAINDRRFENTSGQERQDFRDAIQTFLKSNLTKAGDTATLDRGKYRIANSFGPLRLEHLSGTLKFDKGATIVCDNLDAGCVEIEQAHNLTIDGANITYEPRRTKRNGAQLLAINHSVGVTVRDAELYNGNSSALHMGDCAGCAVENVILRDMNANGFFGSNVKDLRVSDLHGENLGDAAFEISAYDSVTGECREVTATRITATDSVGGILVNGCQNVVVTDFVVRGLTHGSGAMVTQDQLTTTKSFPDRVELRNGLIENVSHHGIDIGLPRKPPKQLNIALTNITIRNSGLDGVNIMAPQESPLNVNLRNVGVCHTGASRVGFRIFGDQIVASHLMSLHTGAFGLYIASRSFIGTNIEVYKPEEKAANNHHAVVINTDGKVELSDLAILGTGQSQTNLISDQRPDAPHVVKMGKVLDADGNRQPISAVRGGANEDFHQILKLHLGIASTPNKNAIHTCKAFDADTLSPLKIELTATKVTVNGAKTTEAILHCQN